MYLLLIFDSKTKELAWCFWRTLMAQFLLLNVRVVVKYQVQICNMIKQFRSIIGLFLFFGVVFHGYAGQINVAVASNALAAIKVISSEFEKKTGHSVILSSGSTGKLYAQIINGAPFDVFLAANAKEPKNLEQKNLVVPGSRFTYALGKLVAWSSDETLLKSKDVKNALMASPNTRVAIANPKTAPYGLAAQQAIQKMGIWQSLQSKIIRGENVSQAYQFAMTNNAQIGFVAKSQLKSKSHSVKGSYQEVPADLYDPIRQQAVWLLRSQNNKVAQQFIEFIKNDNKVKEILTLQFGYGLEPIQSNS